MVNVADLTPRELQILQLVLTGKTNRAIANDLTISERTVEFHLDHIYTKIGVRTRMMAGFWAIRNRLGTKTGEIHS
jgi:DNA-binding NarL/FixJ family response regulator